MAIEVFLSTSLRRHVPHYDPHLGLKIPHHPGLTAQDLMRQLGIPPEEVKVVMRNGKAAPHDTPLDDGDRVGLFPAVGGG